MEKTGSGQLELFSQAKSGVQGNASASKVFITCISKYERVLLIFIGFVITGIISFSFGVEKGKSSAMLKTDSHLDIAAKVVPAPIVVAAPVFDKAANNEPYQLAKEIKSKEFIQNYTIQVASYMNRISAQKDAEALKKKGLSTTVLSKGKFSVVCVGSFMNREEAETLLPRLKKQYQDCRIRRL
jgi:hypothetical protein